ncbi:hypothetical protein [Henriciella sp.]|uniref:hypothetical protein n=1 Tax=Henriciella sp. TaxID=1968823 RepID=UPI000C0D90DD|nr:hypothetical protein [Henriciella sp.]PHR83089.1 MAG: hypothetical protein COA64_00085 [Henriciella sp.]
MAAFDGLNVIDPASFAVFRSALDTQTVNVATKTRDDGIKQALRECGLDAEDLPALMARLSRSEQGPNTIISIDGVQAIELHPLRFTYEEEGDRYIMKITQPYRRLSA